MKRQAFNPYLPSWEYIPDGAQYVFGDRVYMCMDRMTGTTDMYFVWKTMCAGRHL